MIRQDLIVIVWLGLVVVASPVYSQWQGQGQGQWQGQGQFQGQGQRQGRTATDCVVAGISEVQGRCDVYLSCRAATGIGYMMSCPEGTAFNGDTGECTRINDPNHRCFQRGSNNNQRQNNNNNNNNNRVPVVNNNNNNNRGRTNNNRGRTTNNNRGRTNTNTNNNQGRTTNNNQGRTNTNTNNNRGRNNNNNNTNRGRNTNFNQGRTNRAPFQGQSDVIIPMNNVRTLTAANCERIQYILNQDFSTLVMELAGVRNPALPNLRMDCANQQIGQNRPNTNQRNPTWRG